MQGLISFNDAINILSSQGMKHLGHLLFSGKCIHINNKMYLTKEQFKECKSKDSN